MPGEGEGRRRRRRRQSPVRHREHAGYWGCEHAESGANEHVQETTASLDNTARDACAGGEVAGPGRKAGLVSCLDQLRFQEAVLAPIFVGKVQQWAGMSRGCFPVKRDEEKVRASAALSVELGPAPVVRWEQVEDLPMVREGLDWTPVP